MNQTIRFNETTYDFKYGLGVDSKKDAYEVFDIYIDGNKSIYHLEEGSYTSGPKKSEIIIPCWYLIRDKKYGGISSDNKELNFDTIVKFVSHIRFLENKFKTK